MKMNQESKSICQDANTETSSDAGAGTTAASDGDTEDNTATIAALAAAAAAETAAQERSELQQFIEDLQTKIDAKMKLRAANSNFEYPNEKHFGTLDSSLKKNTAFVKKLKQFTSTQLDVTLRDMATLNLSKYISEICAALSETKLKMTDVNAVVTLCSQLHQTYADFDQYFFEAWQRALALKAGEKVSNPSKMRVDLRLFAELVSSGVINTKQGLTLLGTVLVHLIAQDKEDHSNFSIILSFCRHCGEEYAGLVPSKMLLYATKYDLVMPKSDFLPADKQLNLRSLLKDYFKCLCRHVLSEQADLMNMTKNIRRTMESKGEISGEKKEKCELMQANFDKLLSSAQTLSDLIGEPLPEMASESENCNPGTIIENMLDDTAFGELDPWGDEETKSFYIDLPDLRQFLPNFSAPKVDLEQIDEPGEMTEEAIDANIDADLDLDDPPSTTSDPGTGEREAEGTAAVSAMSAAEATIASEDATARPSGKDKIGNALMEVGRQNAQANASGSAGDGGTIKYQFNIFLQNLFNCVNKELIDSAAIEFLLNFNTKNNRKKVTKTIFGVQRTRLDILPFLSRFVAIVNLCNTDIATDLGEMLRKEFKWHIRKKNQLNIESKIKIVRFIGELVKFGLFKKFDALGCLKMLLRDFQHHQIEMACAFVEVAGVYLYNCRDSRLLTNVFLDQMLRLKTATALDSRHAAQIECVYYLVKPPETVKSANIMRPPIHEYIRHLIFEELCKQNVDRCIKMMRRINWHDSIIGGYAIKCLSKAYLLRFPLIRCLADLVSGLSSYQPRAVTIVIDNVFEDIRAGLEIHSPKLAQRRIAMAKYLGELYNYKLVESTHILNTLYSIISLGVSTDQSVVSPIDPPDSLFRLKLACVLMDTCGPYFTSTMTRKKVDYFLVFFQHYYWFKKSHPVFSRSENTSDLFPILVDHMYRDCLTVVRPKLKVFKSLEQAKEAIEKLKDKLYPQLKENSNLYDESYETNVPTSEASELDDAASDYSSSATHRRARDEIEASADQANTTEHDWTENEIERETYALPPPPEKSKEDLEFEQMYEKMTSDSYQERLKETIKPNTKDIPVPMMVRTQKKTYDPVSNANLLTAATSSSSSSSLSTAHTIATTSTLTTTPNLQRDMNAQAIGCTASTTAFATTPNDKDVPSSSSAKNGAVPFVLMVRGGKGGKQQLKSFVAPSDSHLAINLKMQEEKIREEKEKVKRLTLNITERIEEEDYEESLLQPQRHYSQNHYQQRAHRNKFKHQKGAPDADLIFH